MNGRSILSVTSIKAESSRKTNPILCLRRGALESLADRRRRGEKRAQSLLERNRSAVGKTTKSLVWDRAGIQQQLRAYGGRHNGETDRENRASLDRLERTTKDVCFLVSILQVREQVVSFYVSFPESALNASIALIVSIPRDASMDGLALLSSSGRDH